MIKTKSENPFAEKAAETPAKSCPLCGKPATFATRPFCSKRCADVDLHRWLSGVYAIPDAPTAAGDANEDTEGQDAAKS
ncbi:MAG TPA: DNA gyrase inhibitor YacG [Methylocella sp.]|nr:DNA gyrase inhibitor YacG [Methylocella sp.]